MCEIFLNSSLHTGFGFCGFIYLFIYFCFVSFSLFVLPFLNEM